MPKRIIVTADDFGLTRGATDAILQTADEGALNRVSVLANGSAVDYALSEWKKRPGTLSLSIHLNLTEGKALSVPSDIPHLVDSRGEFCNSPLSLLWRTVVAWPRTKRELAREIEHEITAQLTYVQSRIGNVGFSIDGHQHVHMVPLVFCVLAKVHAQWKFSSIRVPREPFFISSDFFPVAKGFMRHMGLNFLSWVNERSVSSAGIPRTDFFIGTLLSGRLTMKTVRSALEEVQRREGTTVEIGVHPGKARVGELDGWRGDTDWHYSHWRENERTLLINPEFSAMLTDFEKGTFTRGNSGVLEIVRFAISGTIAGGISLALLYLFTDVLRVWYLLAAVVSYGIGIGISFTLQKFWTFSHRSLEKVRGEIAWYVLNNLAGIAADAVGIFILVEYFGVWYMAAQVFLLALIALWNFFVYKKFIFRAKSGLL